MGPGSDRRGADAGRRAQPCRAAGHDRSSTMRTAAGCTRGRSSTPPTKRGWSRRRRSYNLVAGQIQRSAMAQLALTRCCWSRCRSPGWLIARRERRSQDEQRQLERRLAESQKMEAIGKLAGGVAHDFNNMLTAILGYASMIQEDAPPKSAIRDQALQIRTRRRERRGADAEAAGLQPQAGAAGRPGRFRARCSATCCRWCATRVGEDITVTTQMGEDLWPILADPVQVEQSIVNLAINARDAMPNGGTLQITARNAPRPQGRAASRRRREARRLRADHGDRHRHRHGRSDAHADVRAVLHDQGAGQGHRPRPVDGLRLRAPVRRLHRRDVDAGAGHVDRTAAAARASARAGHADTPPSRSDAGRRRTETVLSPKTKRACAQLAVESLERRGYRVLAAASGEEALKLAERLRRHDPPAAQRRGDARHEGPELADRLRALRPGIRVLLMSGYAADVVTPGDLKDATLLSKPFSPAALVKAVRASLDVPLSSTPASQG